MSTQTKIKPLGKRVLIKRLPIEERTTDAGLIIPENQIQETYRSEIVDVGKYVDKDLSIGDTVLVSHMVGDLVTVNQEKFYLVNDSEILAILSIGQKDRDSEIPEVLNFSIGED